MAKGSYFGDPTLSPSDRLIEPGMSSHQLPDHSFHEGSPQPDTHLVGDTGETRGHIDNAPNRRATSKIPVRRVPTLNWGDSLRPERVGETSSGLSSSLFLPGQVPCRQCEPDPAQSPSPPTSATLSNRSSHTCVDSDGIQSPDLQQDASVDGGQSAGEFAESPQGLPHRTEEDVLIARPAGPPLALSETIDGLCAIDVVEDYERYKRGYC